MFVETGGLLYSAMRVAGLLLCAALLPSRISAQEQVSVRTDFLFYGDNTEFSNAFRDGETMFGATARVALEISLNDRVTVAAGAFGNQRFGSERSFEKLRPVLSLTVRGRRSSFVLGTLPPVTSDFLVGPDRGGPHELLPPIQRETLTYERPYEAGVGWWFKGSDLQHHLWLEWQRVNTPEHRERFDGGVRTSYRISPILSIPFHFHVVHEGGQLFASGPVADSAAVATGATVHAPLGAYATTVDVLAVGSSHVPDRSQRDLSRKGRAFFGRVAAERSAWRAHVIFWRGRNFIKDEGDPNYLSIFQSGEPYRGTRDYSEAGLTRRFTLARAAVFDVAARVHRVEGRYAYSYRILSVVSAFWKIR
jgi:hypothetical protein